MQRIAEGIVDSLITHEIICKKDRSLYTYGFHQGFILLGNMFTTVVIGWIYGAILEGLVFLSAYIFLRLNAGGYHAKTPLRCYLLSTVIVIAALSGIQYIPWNVLIAASVLLVSCVIIVGLAPMEDADKPLDSIEKLVYKKRTRGLPAFFVGVAVLFWLISPVISASIIVAILCVAVMLVISYCSNLF